MRYFAGSLHRVYTARRQFFPVFPVPAVILDRGYRLYRRDRRIPVVDVGAGGRLRGAREKNMTWVYVLSGAVACALLVYLVVALIRAEDM
jgi:K+-transporting ATPase KdpF subunit